MMKTKVAMVAEIREAFRAPRQVVSVVDLTRGEAARIRRMVDAKRRKGEISSFFMAPLEVVESGFAETLEAIAGRSAGE